MAGVDIRTEKSGIALEAQQKIHSKYDAQLAQQLLEWVKEVTGEPISTGGSPDNLAALFKDGSLLCRLANALQPGSIKKVNTSATVFEQMENISFFLAFAEKHIHKAELFQTVDLYEAQDLNAVIICLSALARKSEKLFGKAGLGPKESEGEKRQWTEKFLEEIVKAEVRVRMYVEYDAEVAILLLRWIEKVIGRQIQPDGNSEQLMKTLKDGLILTQLAEGIVPGSMKGCPPKDSNKAVDCCFRIDKFLDFAAMRVGKSCNFKAKELFNGKNPTAVLICLSTVAKHWAEEQMRNEGAADSGHNSGDPSHL